MVLAMAYQMFKLKSTNLVQIVVTETGDSFLMNFTDALIGFEIFNWSKLTKANKIRKCKVNKKNVQPSRQLIKF